MNQSDTQSEIAPPVSLQPVGNFVTPSLPATGAFRLLANKAKQRFSKKKSQPFIADDQHSKASAETLRGIASAPACGSLLSEIDRAFDDWLLSKQPDSLTKVVVLPPGDESNIIETWAQQHTLQILEPPSRHDLLSKIDFSETELKGSGVLVIPRLERWFLRTHDGLRAVRALMSSLDQQDRQCVIGCNSWAWAFLSKAINIDSLLPDAYSPVAFDAVRLHAWLSELALLETRQTINFRSTENGDRIFDIDDEGNLKSEYLKELAARSYGVPWVAWHLWRNSIRSINNEQLQESLPVQKNNAPQKQTTWLAPLTELEFEDGAKKGQLLVLHALLVHGLLSLSELTRVLESVDSCSSVPGLIRAGFIKRGNESMYCNPLAYGVIRDALMSAGFSMDKL